MKCLLFPILILNFLTNILTFDDFQLRFDVKKTSDDFFIATLKIGKKKYDLLIDTSSSISTIKKIFHTYSNKIDHNEYVFNYLEKFDVSGHFHQENLNNDEKSPIIFLLSPDFQYKGTYGVLGLAYDENENNILYKLKLNGNIKKLIFSIKPLYGLYNKYELYFGDYHDDFDLNETNKYNVGYCDMVHKRDSYSCIGNNIIITNNEKEFNIPINLKIIFDTGSDLNYAPLYLKDKFLEAFKDKCVIQYKVNNGKKIYFLSCRNINKKMYISFVINGFSYIYSNYHLFVHDHLEEDHTLTNMIFLFDENIDYILLGVPFIEQYHILFDLEDNKIFFHNDREFNGDDFIKTYPIDLKINNENIKKSEIKYIYVITFFITVIMFINIFLIIKKVYKYVGKKKEENEEELIDI
jgi:hypothetical protein